MTSSDHFNFYEFFAGAGMVRAGLGSPWKCLFANDFDGKKALTYQDNWGIGGELCVSDIRQLRPEQLPARADLAWASFPCQDLSLAGAGAGLKGERSGTFYPFWKLMQALQATGRGPKIIALENVCGTLTSHQGKDFQAICEKFSQASYRYGAVVIDAALFVPQSRPRLFIIGVRDDIQLDPALLSPGPNLPFHSRSLQNAYDRLSERAKDHWIWWNLPSPRLRTSSFSDIIEAQPTGVAWHSLEQTQALLSSMSALQLAKVEAAKRAGRQMVGAVYKRTRPDKIGRTVRAEVRFDDIAGCLRTPNGGSSRQTILIVKGQAVRSRLISTRETARLMGLPEAYRLPKNYNEAYHLTGDGVAVPVVRFLADQIFQPVLNRSAQNQYPGSAQIRKTLKRGD